MQTQSLADHTLGERVRPDAAIREVELRRKSAVEISTEVDDASWDRFVQETPGGRHVQSSLWGELKRTHNWAPVRIAMSENGKIVACAQFLTKRVPLIGGFAYLPQGPVVDPNSALRFEQIVQLIDEGMKRHGIRLAFITPSRHEMAFADYLQSQGLAPHDLSSFPRATAIIDLHQDEDAILRRMKPKARYNIRYAQRHGVTVREAGKDELHVFYRMLQKTAERNHFEPSSLQYFEDLYDLFSKNQHIRLFMAEHEGEILSSILLIAFGDTVVYKRGGWSGEKGHLKPNEALQWSAICWAKNQGYRYYDLEGLMEKAARAVLEQKEIPEDALSTYTSFKLGFGGDVFILPKTFIYSRNPLIRRIFQSEKLIARLINRGKRHIR
jgi:lipid II:glycine glycyltransferase (peptidoglycan interpeptide bridge formation enzyme)